MLDSLSPVKVAQTLGDFGTGDVQTTHGPLWVLTNGLCENTGYWHTEVFRYHGASYQAAAGQEPYPLTHQEAAFIQPDGIDLPGYATDLHLGYSVWWQNRKWLSPLLEYCYEPEDPAAKHHGVERGEADFFSRLDCLRAFVECEAERLSVLLHPMHGEVLLDLEGFTDRYAIHLLVPCGVVLGQFRGSEAWQHFLRALFPATETPSLIYIDTNCEQERGGLPGLSNAVGKSYGCALYDLTQAPSFVSADRDDGELLEDWLHEQEACLKVWGPSEEAAVHNARLACDEHSFVPVNPLTRRYLPRQAHMLPS